MSDVTSSAMPRCKAIKAAGLKPVFEILTSHKTYQEGLMEEACKIAELDGLVNVQRFNVVQIMSFTASLPRFT
jgi:hypothetical protein